MPLTVDQKVWKSGTAALKSADKKVLAGMRKGIREVAKPVAQSVLTEGADQLGHAGGLAGRVASRTKPSITVGANDVRIRLAGGAALGRIDASGVARHPVFGHRSVWRGTNFKPAIFSSRFAEHAEDVRRAAWNGMRQALDTIKS